VSDHPEPPPPPEQVSPDVASWKVLQVTEDGARWRWAGIEWEMVDPPGTDEAAIRHHQIVAPLLDLAGRLDRDEPSEEAAIAALLALPGCDRSALIDAAAMLGKSANSKVQRVEALLRSAAERAT
jgi:hypothetical protein